MAPENRPPIDFENMTWITANIVTFKQRLRNEIDRRGGIALLSRKSGMSESSLSRFFNSAALPRRITLYKIAYALELKQGDVEY